MPAEAPNPGDPRAAGPTLAISGGFVRSGKVRDLFDVGDRLLLVASDRLSAFDVVLPTPIPDKGRVLTGLSRFWFSQTADIIPNHLLGTDPAELPADFTDEAGLRELRGRMMLCRRACSSLIACPSRSSRRRPRPKSGTMRTSASTP